MKNNYMKPDVEYIEIDAAEDIMNGNNFGTLPSIGVGEDDSEEY